VWTRDIAGLRLTFHLAGINNQNFLMRDDQTGTYWQQINGKAVSGPLAGSQLTLVHSDELNFGTWQSEQPGGTVLQDTPRYRSEYEPKDWDVRMQKARTVIDFREHGLKGRDLMLGIQASGASRAFPYGRVIREKLVEDRVGAEPVLLVVGADGQSVRAFRDRIPGIQSTPDFYHAAGNQPGALLMDASTGSEWNFQEPVDVIKDYWFDWRNYNPSTTVYGVK
jgi:Protein of unknown function (DUF3179)